MFSPGALTGKAIFYVCLAVAILAGSLLGLRSLIRGRTADANKPAAKTSSTLSHLPPIPDLTIEKIVQHGHILEIRARVQPGTTVMINGRRAAVLWDGGEIKHFVGPLPDGINDIAVTAQNDEGGINSQKLSVVLP